MLCDSAHGRATTQQGVALIEVIVSLAVAAMFLSWLIPSAESAVRRVRIAEKQLAAVRIARNAISQLDANLDNGVERVGFSGRQSGLRWRIREVSDLVMAPDRDARSPALHRYTIEVSENDVQPPILNISLTRVGGLK